MSRQRARKSERKPDTKPVHKKSPRIYRYITEWRMWIIATSIVLVLIGVALAIQYGHSRASYLKNQVEREKVVKEVSFWEDIVTKYSDYRDAYFRISILYYRLGDMAKAQEYLAKTLELDPNFEKGREFEQYLNP